MPILELKVLPYNRVVADLNGHTQDESLAQVGAHFEIVPSENPEPAARQTLTMYIDGGMVFVDTEVTFDE